MMQSLFQILGVTFNEFVNDLRPLKNSELGIYLEEFISNLKRKFDAISKVILNTVRISYAYIFYKNHFDLLHTEINIYIFYT